MKNRQICVRLAEEEYENLEAIADRRRLPISDVIRMLISEEQNNDMLKQILVNTTFNRVVLNTLLDTPEKNKKANELWELQKEELGVSNE